MGQINTQHTSALTACSRDPPSWELQSLKATLVNLPCFTWVRQSLDRPNMAWVICLGASEVTQKQSNIKRSGSQVISTHPCGKWGSGFLKRIREEEENLVTHEILWGQVTYFHFWDHLPQQSFSVAPPQHFPPDWFWLLQTRQTSSLRCWKWFCLCVLHWHWEKVSKYLWLSD